MPTHESIRPRIKGLCYEGGMSLDNGVRPERHSYQGRTDLRRASRKRTRQRWKREFPTDASCD